MNNPYANIVTQPVSADAMVEFIQNDLASKSSQEQMNYLEAMKQIKNQRLLRGANSMIYGAAAAKDVYNQFQEKAKKKRDEEARLKAQRQQPGQSKYTPSQLSELLRQDGQEPAQQTTKQPWEIYLDQLTGKW